MLLVVIIKSSIIINTNGWTSASVPNMIINSGNVGIGVLNPNGLLSLFGTTNLQPKITLIGTKFYQGTNTNEDGIGFILGVNRTDNYGYVIQPKLRLILLMAL